MKRRQVVTGLLAMAAVSVLPRSVRRSSDPDALASLSCEKPFDGFHDLIPTILDPLNDNENRVFDHIAILDHTIGDTVGSVSSQDKESSVSVDLSAKVSSAESQQEKIQAQVNKSIHFEHDYDDDIFVSEQDRPLLQSAGLRLKRLQSAVGHGNFNILSFDDALKFARRFNKVGAFTKSELNFIEQLFVTDAVDYGFYGDKVVDQLSYRIPEKETFKVPHTGHYLLKDQSLAYYKRIRNSVGEEVVLTSGIRSNVKQLDLFLAKVIRVKGNLSRASRSLAPPGYSYHGIGDFDVGRAGWGGENFTDAFSLTDEFKRMQDLGYVAIRYDHGNQLGVRFEPWHIKVV